jgi:hypothetical protein
MRAKTSSRGSGAARGGVTSLLAGLARCTGVAIFTYVLASWVRLLVAGGDTIDNKDWVGFYRVGWLLRHGELSRLYTDPANVQQPFLNPPWFVWFCAPIGTWASPWPPYLICVAVAVFGSLTAVLLVRRAAGAPAGRTLTAGTVLFGSAAWLGCAQTGQLSGLLLVMLAAALWAWCAESPFAAGLILAGLSIKPNIFLPLLFLAAVGRHTRVVAGAVLGLTLLALSTLPLGLYLWHDYRVASEHMLRLAFDGTLAPWMHQTLLAFWIWVLGPAHLGLAPAAWSLTAGLAAATAANCWWRATAPAALPRLFGQAVLALVAVSPYLFYYDGLLLALPAMVWYFQADGFVSRRSWLACGALLVLIFIWQQVQMFSRYSGCPPLIGPLVLAWLLVDARDLHAARRSRRTSTA